MCGGRDRASARGIRRARTGRAMKALYVAVTTSKNWGPDIVGSQVALDG